MEYLQYAIDFIIHLDKHLNEIIQYYGVWTYLILALVLFAETGLVVTPFLPGDSLLFAIGTLAALGSIDVYTILMILPVAVIIGDNTNYWLGRYIGPKIFLQSKIRFIKKEHLDKTQKFYEKYGVKTIILARYMPIVRTFAPFVAGIGKMNYLKFFTFSLIGGITWIFLFVLGGYFFGNIPFIKSNFSIVIFVIIFLSVLPGLIEYIKAKRTKPEPEK